MAKKEKYITKDGQIVLLIMFEGKVQMVSFRATSNEFATLLGLSGKVSNTDDGEVELILKGKPNDVDKCIYQLEDEFELTNTRAQRMPISFWPDEYAHYVDYCDGTISHYTPRVEKINTVNDLGLCGDRDFCGDSRKENIRTQSDYFSDEFYDSLSQADKDFIDGKISEEEADGNKNN